MCTPPRCVLAGAVVYYDGQMNDTRMNVLIALTAMQKGAVGANYTEVEGDGRGRRRRGPFCAPTHAPHPSLHRPRQLVSVTHDVTGRANGAIVRDVETGRQWPVRARAVINAAGCFGDAVRQLDDATVEPLIQVGPVLAYP